MSDNPPKTNRANNGGEERLRIYFLPNLMTAGNLLCGFLALWYIVKVTPPVAVSYTHLTLPTKA